MPLSKLQSGLAPSSRQSKASVARPATSDMITIGKDVLELLSSAMYVDPLTIYREYIQNAADAIDDARVRSLLTPDEPGRVEITMDPVTRTVRLRDNGSGISVERAAATLLAIGASGKRGAQARGFRGVGRLAGLAYCRELIFRTRTRGDDQIAVVRWDCVKLKSTLREVNQSDDLPGVIERIVSIKEEDGAGYPEHFLEVELGSLVRTRKDSLLAPHLVEAYLAQVAPVPFSEAFSFGGRIKAHLAEHDVRVGDLEITIGPEGDPIRRPHRDTFQVSDTVSDAIVDIEPVTFVNDQGAVAAGWIGKHANLGHISVKSQIGGLRLRAGNIQIGGPELVDEIFPEARFNGWTVGEIHVLDPRVLPNARRDHFEQNPAFADLMSELAPLGRDLSRNCRAASVERNRVKQAAFDEQQSHLLETPRSKPATDTSKATGVEPPAERRIEDAQVSDQASPFEHSLSRQIADILGRAGVSKAEAGRAIEDALRLTYN